MRTIPVTVVGGYLGAGKTTLVNHLLRNAGGERIAVLVNDFGDVGIDAELIESREGDVINLAGGCVCCSFGSDLVAALMRLPTMDPAPERVIETAWGKDALSGGSDGRTRRFPAEVEVRASDRPGLLRDITEVFARDRLNVIAVQTLSRAQVASMRFTVEVPDAGQLARTLAAVRDVSGVIQARRR